MPLGLQNIEYDSEIRNMLVWKDSDGSVILNSASAMFPQPRVEPMSVGIVMVEYFTPTYSEAIYYQQLNAVNNATWRVWGEGEAWISKIRWRPGYNIENTVGHLLNYEIRIYEYKWTSQYPECGYVYKDGSEHKTFIDSDGMVMLGLLTEDGAKLDVGDPAVIKESPIRRSISFSGLGF